MNYRLYDSDELSESCEEYTHLTKKRVLIIVALLLFLFVVIVVATFIGSIKIPFLDVIRYIFTFDDSGDGYIVWNIRLVSILAAVLVGASLSSAGTSMQCILRNPLASPYTLGISGAAAFGAAFSIVILNTGSMASSSIIVSNPFVTTTCAFIFSMIAVLIIIILTKITNVSPETMVLAGIAISAMFTAGLSFLQYIASEDQLGNIISWMFGDLSRATWSLNLFLFAILLITSTFFITKRWTYNALDSGDESAKALGVDVTKERVFGLVMASLLSSIAVSFFGIISFIGLLGPHIARMIIGGDHRYLMPASMIIGASVLVIADVVGKTIMSPHLIPVGIVTSMLGCPLFVYLLIRRYRA